MLLDKEDKTELSDQLQTIVDETVAEIAILADQANQTIEESTHVIRKRLKFLRAVVKLTMYCSNNVQYKELNFMLRDLGREISDCRDHHVKGLLLQEICQDSLFRSVKLLVEELILINREETEKEEQELLSGENVFMNISSHLSGHQDFTTYFSTLRADFDSIMTGFFAGYSKSSRAFHSGLIFHSVESLHEWRKRTKDLQYQYEVLMESIPYSLPPDYPELVELCETLGRINDLYMLSAWISKRGDLADHSELNPVLLDKIEQELITLRKRSETNGNSLYRYTPEEYRKKLIQILE